ncbi:MAG: hypothetical protein AAF761_10970, partial [Pseudomonadota bacterium]
MRPLPLLQLVWRLIWSTTPSIAALVAFSALTLGVLTIYRAEMGELPAVRVLERLEIDRNALARGGGRADLGYRELGQVSGGDSAEERHISVELDLEGSLLLRNVATVRRLGLTFEGGSLTDRDYLLRDGDQFSLGGRSFVVAIPQENRLLLRDAANENIVLSLPQPYFPVPASLTDERQAQAVAWHSWMSYSAVFGGRVPHDPSSWGERFGARELGELLLARDPAPPITVPLERLAANSLSIRNRDGQFFLSLRSALSVAVCPKGGACFELGRQAWPLAHSDLGALRSIVAGRTRYRVEPTPSGLTLTPIDRVHWLTWDKVIEARQAMPAAVRAFYPNRQGIPVYFNRGLPGTSTASMADSLTAALQSMTAMAAAERANSRPLALLICLLLMALAYAMLRDQNWASRLFVRLPGWVLLALLMPPALRTLPLIPLMTPAEVF